MKSDLLAVLPTDLREALLWKASDEGPFYKFRDMVLTQNAKILMNRRRLPIHAVQEENEEDNEDVKPEGINSMEDLLMAIQRWTRRGQRTPGPRSDGPARTRSAPAPPARKRKCPNCGEEHAALKCPRPAVEISERKCWECNEKGHVSRDCKKRQGKIAIKAIEDRQDNLNGFFMVDEDGFTKVATGSRGRRATRPMPSTPCLGSFFSKNSWEALTAKNERHDEGSVIKMKKIVEATGASRPSATTSSSTSSPTTTSRDVPGGMGLPAEEAHPPKRRGLGSSSTGSSTDTGMLWSVQGDKITPNEHYVTPERAEVS